MTTLPLCLLLILGVLPDILARECRDRASWCEKIGTGKIPLSRCYINKHARKCCASCQRLRLPIPNCPFGDKESWCSEIEKVRPVADCYAHNTTCCQTCLLYDTGIQACAYGDKASWCSRIGTQYSISSCYDHHIHCCGSCQKYKSGIPDCDYGDKLVWCQGIGEVFPRSHCNTSHDICCKTCHMLEQAEKIVLPGMDDLASPTTKTSTSTFKYKTSTSLSPSSLSSYVTTQRSPVFIQPASSNSSSSPSSVSSQLSSTSSTSSNAILATMPVIQETASNHHNKSYNKTKVMTTDNDGHSNGSSRDVRDKESNQDLATTIKTIILDKNPLEGHTEDSTSPNARDYKGDSYSDALDKILYESDIETPSLNSSYEEESWMDNYGGDSNVEWYEGVDEDLLAELENRVEAAQGGQASTLYGGSVGATSYSLPIILIPITQTSLTLWYHLHSHRITR